MSLPRAQSLQQPDNRAACLAGRACDSNRWPRVKGARAKTDPARYISWKANNIQTETNCLLQFPVLQLLRFLSCFHYVPASLQIRGNAHRETALPRKADFPIHLPGFPYWASPPKGLPLHRFSRSEPHCFLETRVNFLPRHASKTISRYVG